LFESLKNSIWLLRHVPSPPPKLTLKLETDEGVMVTKTANSFLNIFCLMFVSFCEEARNWEK